MERGHRAYSFSPRLHVFFFACSLCPDEIESPTWERRFFCPHSCRALSGACMAVVPRIYSICCPLCFVPFTLKLDFRFCRFETANDEDDYTGRVVVCWCAGKTSPSHGEFIDTLGVLQITQGPSVVCRKHRRVVALNILATFLFLFALFIFFFN